MLTEWFLVIWLGNEYPMTNRESFTAATVIDRFNKEKDCINSGNNWVLESNYRHFTCIKIEKEIQTKDTE